METYYLLKYLSNTLLEKQIYFVVPTFLDNTVKFEIMWEKGEEKPWSFSLYRADNWTKCSTLDILDALEEVECDLVVFRRQVIDKILTQVAYMNMRINDARELLGSDVVDASVVAHEEFGKSLAEAINKLLPNKPKGLHLVED
jgi:hypothetical protein